MPHGYKLPEKGTEDPGSEAGVAAPALFASVAVSAEERIGEFNPQDLSNTVWAYATAGVAAPGFFKCAAIALRGGGRAGQRIGEFKPVELANTVWAYATRARRA